MADGGEGGSPSQPANGGLTRRRFIAGASAAGGAVVLDVAISQANKAPGLINQIPSSIGRFGGIVENTTPSITLLARRREDMLYLRIDGYNIDRQDQRLVRQVTGRDALIVVGFEPQHITEQSFNDPVETPVSPGGSKALMAFPSRLAFKLPAGVDAIPLTLASLLNWAKLDPVLVPAAAYVRPGRRRFIAADATAARAIPRGSKPPKLRAPAATETALELPWRLAISPTSTGHWSHPTGLVHAGGWTELWHTRLAAGSDRTALDGGAFRAVWNFDTRSNGKPTLGKKKPPMQDEIDVPPYGPGNPAPSPFRTSLSANDRWQIVHASSDFNLAGQADVEASKLWLTARGGFLDSNGVWENLPKLTYDLLQWRHLATLGRDQYVKVVHKGYLFPFGHRAVEVVVSERRFERVGSDIVATFRQIIFLVVRQPDKSYDPAATFGVVNDSRDLPFRQLTLKTLRTPPIVPKAFVTGPPGFFNQNPFVPYLAGKPFQWHFVGTDWNGKQSAFTVPAVFVTQPDGLGQATAAAVRKHYNGLGPKDSVRLAQFQGDQVAFAETKKPGDTNLEVHTISFGAGAGTDGASDNQFANHDQPRTYPNVAQAEIRLTAAEQASGGGSLGMPTVKFNDKYRDHGFNAPENVGNVFMEMLGSGPKIDFGGGSAGGVMTPNLSLTGLSRSLGPVAGSLDSILGGHWDPAEIFKDVEAKILGGVNLIDLIQKIALVAGFGAHDHAHYDPETLHDDGALKITYETDQTTLTTDLTWKPELKDNPIVSSYTGKGGSWSFELDGELKVDLLHPENVSAKIDGKLENFTVSLMDNTGGPEQFIGVDFNKLTFHVEKGQKSKTDVDIDQVRFLGVLKFVEQLQQLMDFTGDGGPKITVTPTEISAEIGVKLPELAVGVFSISNIGVDAAFNLPFNGDPARFRFSISTRDDPFTLSVAIFGGQGFFGIAIGTDGVELIEASFDFGAMASLDIGVASGSVQLVAGIYFAYGQINPPSTATGCILTGFVKLDGSLSILGIITLSLEFDLSLTYQESAGQSSVTGTATLTVGIKIFFFSASVSMTASKTFGNGQTGMARDVGHRRLGRAPDATPPPTFADQMSSSDWNAYCGAFATS